jgi:hypothetical protein
MTGAGRAAGQAPGVVKIRLLGAAEDIEPVAELLAAHGQVIEQSAPYPNRRDPGVRVYMTLQVQEGGK